MDILCPRCGTQAIPAGHEDARAIYRCESCNRVWMTHLAISSMGPRHGAATRVLVVDDSDQLVALLGAWLEDDGCVVATATTGMRAIEVAAAEMPDIVLLDLILPPPDGFTLCRLLQRSPHPPIVIVMTGVSDVVRLREIDGLCVFAILSKPITKGMVLGAVSRARRQRQEDTPRPAAP